MLITAVGGGWAERTRNRRGQTQGRDRCGGDTHHGRQTDTKVGINTEKQTIQRERRKKGGEKDIFRD
jgi:hypothetical protein